MMSDNHHVVFFYKLYLTSRVLSHDNMNLDLLTSDFIGKAEIEKFY